MYELESEILEHWQKQDIFAKTLKHSSGKPIFSFYDGPPFITGTPHYATLLPSIAKDVISRYQTMKGRYVRRIWGWDTHGLPAETQVEKKLGLKVKKDIEKLGIDKFISECRKYVAEVSDSWRWYIDRIGRWADLDRAYRTDQLHYMESVIWVFKQLFDKGLIYRGKRVSLFCTRCATPLAKFEVTMDEGSYRPVKDPAVTVAFRLLNDDVYLLAWTTTPWTLPANMALAVKPDQEYVKVSDGERLFILAHQALERYRDLDLEIVETFKGTKLVGEVYEPLFNFFKTDSGDHKIYAADFVDVAEGTGIVHIAPGFGEDDTALAEQFNLTVPEAVDEEGHFTAEAGQYAGLFYKKADPLIIDELRSKSLMIKVDQIIHSYPHCHRCDTPLIYRSQVSWSLKVEPLRRKLLKYNNRINWVPPHFGQKRFRYNLENAPDWSISRTRYWGTPIPVWETEDGEIFVPDSIAEIEMLSGEKVTDLHRPAIDRILLKLPSGKTARRVSDVLDVWFESGSMPFAQDHYPFENQQLFKEHYPADFIVEYTGQLRGWFYYLHLLGAAIMDEIAFKNVAVTGVLMGTDGRKMSKSYGNYPDPRSTIVRYGAESLRLYFMSSKIMRGEDADISEEEIRECSRVLNILRNALQYCLTYAKLDSNKATPERTHILDRWIRSRLEQFIGSFDRALGEYDFTGAAKEIRPFTEDLSTWYIRRSRDRFTAGESAASLTLKQTLLRFAETIAPLLPFMSEKIFRELSPEEESVHLKDYPSADGALVNKESKLLSQMALIRQIASVVHSLRAEAKIALRQPLSSLALEGFEEIANEPDLITELAEEVNVEEVIFAPPPRDETWPNSQLAEGRTVYLDIKLTPELAERGRLRVLIRRLQEARKSAGLKVGQKVGCYYFTRDDELKDLISRNSEEIKRQAALRSLTAAEGENENWQNVPEEELAVRFGES